MSDSDNKETKNEMDELKEAIESLKNMAPLENDLLDAMDTSSFSSNSSDDESVEENAATAITEDSVMETEEESIPTPKKKEKKAKVKKAKVATNKDISGYDIPAATKKKGKKTLAEKNAIAGYLFILPFILGFVLFMIIPLFESLRMSFSSVKVEDGMSMDWIGLVNYNKALRVDPQFVRLLTQELKNMLLDLPATLIFSFFIALLLNQTFKARGFVRAIFFLPVILSSGVIVGIEFNNALVQGMKDVIEASSNTTSITSVLEEMLVSNGSVGSGLFGYIFDLINHVYDIAIASGIQIIIFLSGLQTISPSMFEAAKIEGCTAWESFWKITLPMVSSLILVNVVYTIIDFFVKSDNEVMTKISDTMISMLDYGFSSAMAWIYFICCMVIIGLLSAIISKRVYYYE